MKEPGCAEGHADQGAHLEGRGREGPRSAGREGRDWVFLEEAVAVPPAQLVGTSLFWLLREEPVESLLTLLNSSSLCPICQRLPEIQGPFSTPTFTFGGHH